MAMTKKLSPIGNSYGILIEKPILELLGITPDTELVVTTDGAGLQIRPKDGTRAARLNGIVDELMDKHSVTLAKLAQ